MLFVLCFIIFIVKKNSKWIRQVPLCCLPTSCTRNFPGNDCRKLDSLDEDYHLLCIGGEVRLKSSTNQPDYQSTAGGERVKQG